LSEKNRDASHPFEGYHVISTSGTFPERETAITRLLNPASDAGSDPTGLQFSVLGLPDGSDPLFVRGFFVFPREYSVAVIFREVMRGRDAVAEVRYVIMTQQGDDWLVKAIVAGPRADSQEWALNVLQDLIVNQLD